MAIKILTMKKELTANYVKDTYNDFLSSYDNTYTYFRWQRTPLSRYQFRQSKRVFIKALEKYKFSQSLEIGGGDGGWTPFLLAHTDKLDFLDISTEMLKRAKEQLKDYTNITFIESDFLENSLEDEKYDSVLSFRNFEYFPDKEKAVSEIKRVLKKNGILILVTKNPLYDWKGDIQRKTLHKKQLKIRELINLFNKNGFKVEYVYPTIIGKRLKYASVRWIFDLIHRLVVLLPWEFWYSIGLPFLSESVLMRAYKK